MLHAKLRLESIVVRLGSCFFIPLIDRSNLLSSNVASPVTKQRGKEQNSFSYYGYHSAYTVYTYIYPVCMPCSNTSNLLHELFEPLTPLNPTNLLIIPPNHPPSSRKSSPSK